MVFRYGNLTILHRVLILMGEAYAAIQRGRRAACSGEWGQSDDS